MLWTGIRRNEALTLTWDNVHPDHIVVKGKGSKVREVPLADEARKCVILGENMGGRVFMQYHPDTVSKLFKRCAVQAGVPHARLHDLRHSAATYMLKAGIPIQVVKEILGHAHLSTTMIYVDVMSEQKQKEIRKLRFT